MNNAHDPSASLLRLFGPFGRPVNGLQADVYLAQQLLLTKQQMSLGLINALAGLLIGVISWGATSPYIVVTWTVLVASLGLFQVYTSWRMSKRPEPTSVGGRYLRRGEYACIIAGVLWGGTIWLFGIPSGDTNLILFLFVMHSGMSAGVASIITPLPRHVARFVFPCLTPSILAATYYSGDFAIALSVMGTVFLGALIGSSIMSYKQLRAMLARTHEASEAQTTLLNAINASNDAFALFGDNGELVLANDRHKALYEASETRDAFGAVTTGNRTVRHKDHWLLRSVQEVETGGTVVVHTDVTVMKTRERELVEARREAEEADEAKGRFLSTMSHELRQPLHVIIGNATLMASGSLVELSKAETQEYADDIHQSGEHLLRLIDDIIDYSKVGLGRFMLKPDRIDLRAMIAKAISLAANFEGVKDLSSLDVSISPRLRDLHVDEFVCQRILISLLSNAFRFGSSDARLVIKARVDESGRPYISIRDFGQGLSETDIERVFEPFYQKDNSLSRETSGAGLGLTLCRHLARLHDGDVVLKSRLGAGTSATLILPATSYVKVVDPIEAPETSKRA